jgi:hypothetical protein
MPVTLESRVRRIQVFHLPHEVVCRTHSCACAEVTVVVVAENPRTGERAAKPVAKHVPGSITILARECKAGLPCAVLEVAEVRAAIDRGYLRVVEQTPDPPSAPNTSAPPATSTSSGPSSSGSGSNMPTPSAPTPAAPAPGPAVAPAAAPGDAGRR